MNKEDLKILKEKLPTGYTNILAEKFDLSPSSITKILNNVWERLDVVEFAIKLAEENKNKSSGLSKKIKNL